MAKDSYLTIRIDENLKSDFMDFCKASGLTMGGAINLLAKKTVNDGSLPFSLSAFPKELMEKYDGGEKLNGRINVRIEDDVKDGFTNICKDVGIPRGSIVKMFMLSCISTGEFPF